MAWKKSILADWDEGGLLDADTSKTIKLPPSVISAIHLRLSGTGGAGAVAVDNFIATVKVKSDKGYIFDMASADMLVLARAITGRKPTITNAASAYSETNQSIYFGRHPRDKTFLLDLTKSNVRTMEVTFATLVAATGFATGTVKFTVTIEEWLGDLPPEYKGFISSKVVEDKATGTGKCIFELFSGVKLIGALINIGTITTVRQCTISDKSEKIMFGKANFRDLLNIHNHENAVDAVETLNALWRLADWTDLFNTELPMLSMSDPVLSIERGATTTTSRVVQLSVIS
jgi:hypothetical protein